MALLSLALPPDPGPRHSDPPRQLIPSFGNAFVLSFSSTNIQHPESTVFIRYINNIVIDSSHHSEQIFTELFYCTLDRDGFG
jgi:hypothetical protein